MAFGVKEWPSIDWGNKADCLHVGRQTVVANFRTDQTCGEGGDITKYSKKILSHRSYATSKSDPIKNAMPQAGEGTSRPERSSFEQNHE